MEYEYNPKVIGERIKHERKKLNYSAEQLGYILDVTGRAINNWEAGTNPIPIDKLLILCQTEYTFYFPSESHVSSSPSEKIRRKKKIEFFRSKSIGIVDPDCDDYTFRLFDCDLDYIVGKIDSKRKAFEDIHSYTGLTPQAIQILHRLKCEADNECEHNENHVLPVCNRSSTSLEIYNHIITTWSKLVKMIHSLKDTNEKMATIYGSEDYKKILASIEIFNRQYYFEHEAEFEPYVEEQIFDELGKALVDPERFAEFKSAVLTREQDFGFTSFITELFSAFEAFKHSNFQKQCISREFMRWLEEYLPNPLKVSAKDRGKINDNK